MLLENVTVLDLSRVLSGPFATQQLVDLGAKIIKVENPKQGDDTRRFGPPFIEGESTYFMSVNRGKKSLAVDLKSSEGRAIVLNLAKHCDVVIENFRPGTAQRLGLGPEDFHQANPQIITCSISGYGSGGDPAFEGRAGYDAIIQGASGVMSLTGRQDGPATKVGVAVSDMVAGLYATQGILAALYKRAIEGNSSEPSHIEISMQDAMLSFLTYQAGSYFATGENPRKMGDAHPSICPYETLETKDGPFIFAVGNDKQFETFCRLLDLPDLYLDPRFSTNAARVQHREELLELIHPKIRNKTMSEWELTLSENGIPGGPVLTIRQALEHPQVIAQKTVIEHNHKRCGQVRSIGTPVKHNGIRKEQIPAPPLLGEHSSQVLKEYLDLDNETIRKLIDQGVIRESVEAKHE
ncbi:MAG: CaiB/BaiF CoA-transferase family protein [Myxococcota bacterium]|nr:CaiB/BaiF CoA-transferase family protein [Myxococcota bacterium]